MPDKRAWSYCSRCDRKVPDEELALSPPLCPNCRDRVGVTELKRGRMDHYRGRRVAKGDPCDVCGSEDTSVIRVSDGWKPLCEEHESMFAPP